MFAPDEHAGPIRDLPDAARWSRFSVPWLWAVLAFFVLTGLWVAGFNTHYFVYPDAFEYAQMGREIRLGHGFATGQLLPVFIPYLAERSFLAGRHWPNLSRAVLPTLSNAAAQVFVRDPLAAGTAQSGVFYLLSVPLFVVLAWRCKGAAVALAGALLFAADPLVFESGYNGLSESLAMFLVLAVLSALLLPRDSARKWLAAGALCGAAYLARTNLVFATPIAAAHALVTVSGRARFRAAGLVLAASAVVVAPWAVRNFALTGSPSFSFTTAGTMAWEAVPGPLTFIQLDAPAEPAAMMATHGDEVREKARRNLVENIVSLTFWDRMFATRGLFYRIGSDSSFAFLPFVFFFLLAFFLPRHPEDTCFHRLKWLGLALLISNFLMFCLANHEPRYYVPFRPVVLMVGLGTLLTWLRGTAPERWRGAVVAVAVSLLAVMGAHQFVSVYRTHAGPPDRDRHWLAVTEADRETYAAVAELVPPEAIIASDMSFEVCLLANRRAVRFPHPPADLLVIDDEYLPLDYVLVGRRVLTWRAAHNSYMVYRAFLDSPAFTGRYEKVRELPNGAVFYARKSAPVTD